MCRNFSGARTTDTPCPPLPPGTGIRGLYETWRAMVRRGELPPPGPARTGPLRESISARLRPSAEACSCCSRSSTWPCEGCSGCSHPRTPEMSPHVTPGFRTDRGNEVASRLLQVPGHRANPSFCTLQDRRGESPPSSAGSDLDRRHPFLLRTCRAVVEWLRTSCWDPREAPQPLRRRCP